MNKDKLKKLLEAQGLKADEIEKILAESTDGESDKDKGSKDSVVIANLADSIAKKLTEAIAKNKGLADSDKDSLNKTIKTKIFTSWGGTKEIEYPADVKSLTKEQKIVTFFKALYYSHADDASKQVLRALVEGTDALGGYLVPEELRAEVFRLLPDMAVMRRLARVLPMGTDTLKLNSLTARPSAYWTAEYASKSTTSAELGQVTLQPNDLVCLLPVSEQLIADANIGIVQFIIELFTEAIAMGEDKAFFTGSGTGQPKGISQETITQVDAGLNIGFDTVVSLIHSVPQAVRKAPGAAFVGNSDLVENLRKIKNTTNDYIWRDGGNANNGQTTTLPDRLYGYPFYEQNDLDSRELYFGDWKFYVIGDRQAISVRTTSEGGEAWRRNAVEIKAVERVDGKAVMTSPFAKIVNA